MKKIKYIPPMPFLKFRNAGRRIPRRARMARRRPRRRTRKPMTAGRVKRIIDAELKVRDLGVGPIDFPNITGQIVQISSIAQGDTNLQRQGNWIKPVSWMGTITLEGGAGSSVDTQQFRIGCFVWKENQDSDPAVIDRIVQDVNAPHQQYNVESKGSFKILWSRTGILSNNVDNPQFQKVFRFYVKPTMKILFDDADSRKFHLFIFALSNVATLDSPLTVAFDTRLRFTDS